MQPNDQCFPVPAYECDIARLNRILDPAVVANPTAADQDAIMWLQSAFAFLSHVGRVARYQAAPTANLVMRNVVIPVEPEASLWVEYFGVTMDSIEFAVLETRLAAPE